MARIQDQQTKRRFYDFCATKSNSGRLDICYLRKEVRELRMEREILKIAAAFFAKEQR